MATFRVRSSRLRGGDTLRAASASIPVPPSVPVPVGVITFTGRDGELRIYDGASPPKYLSIPFAEMDFSSQPFPLDLLIL